MVKGSQMGGKRESDAPRNAADPRQQAWTGTNTADTRDPGATPLAEQPQPGGVRTEKDAGPSGGDAAQPPERARTD
jgi:hypothetical protein